MNREEAIKILTHIRNGKSDLMLMDALDMAINALEQEPKILNTLDFAIDASNGDTNYFVGFRNGLRYAKSLIDGEEPQFESCTEQEPSGDLISRIKHAIYKVCLSEGNKDIFVKILDEINKLPSVKQEPKTGHWIEHPTEEDYSVCSRCGIGSRRMEHGKNADGTKYIDIYSYRFCPYCGARMVEPQESEDKE